MQRTLVLMRHAQADSAWGTNDFDRPLASVGQEQARKLGQLLQQAGISFDALYVSSARRAQETAQGIMESVPAAQIHNRDDLYMPKTQTVHEIRLECDEQSIVGVLIHEPAVSELAAFYAKDGRDVEFGVLVATALILTWEGEWSDLSRGCADMKMLCASF